MIKIGYNLVGCASSLQYSCKFNSKKHLKKIFVRESLQKVQLRQKDSLCKIFAELDAEFVFVEKVAKLLCENSYR
jgi:hypothetical protein